MVGFLLTLIGLTADSIGIFDFLATHVAPYPTLPIRQSNPTPSHQPIVTPTADLADATTASLGTLTPLSIHTPTSTSTPTTIRTASPTSTGFVTSLSALPDLVVIGFRTEPLRPIEGSPYREIYTFKNQGYSSSKRCIVRIDWNDGNAVELRIPPLEAGESVEITFEVQGSDSKPFVWQGQAYIDYGDNNAEINDFNNVFPVGYTVFPLTTATPP